MPSLRQSSRMPDRSDRDDEATAVKRPGNGSELTNF
jgi:hypothetical protein